jgi:catechol 2,3-dioxygenase-like lactoylglutathione lyase family enzyme
MIKTYGLTHIALAVEDIDRSIAFYKAVFGAREMYNSDGFAQVQTPGSHDIIVFEQAARQLLCVIHRPFITFVSEYRDRNLIL